MPGRGGELVSQCLDGPATWAEGAAAEPREVLSGHSQPGGLLGIKDQLAGARRSLHWELISLFAGLAPQGLTSTLGVGITSLVNWEFIENWHWRRCVLRLKVIKQPRAPSL